MGIDFSEGIPALTKSSHAGQLSKAEPVKFERLSSSGMNDAWHIATGFPEHEKDTAPMKAVYLHGSRFVDAVLSAVTAEIRRRTSD